jgi:tRNA nucleotidyltransferase (CCA-adding enzyme)
VSLALPPGPSRSAIQSYLARWRHLKPHTTGHDLQALGIQPGAEYQRLLTELRRAWLDGEIHSEAEERLYLARLLNR